MPPPTATERLQDLGELEQLIRVGLRKIDRLLERLQQMQGARINGDFDAAELIVIFEQERARLYAQLNELEAELDAHPQSSTGKVGDVGSPLYRPQYPRVSRGF